MRTQEQHMQVQMAEGLEERAVNKLSSSIPEAGESSSSGPDVLGAFWLHHPMVQGRWEGEGKGLD